MQWIVIGSDVGVGLKFSFFLRISRFHKISHQMIEKPLFLLCGVFLVLQNALETNSTTNDPSLLIGCGVRVRVKVGFPPWLQPLSLAPQPLSKTTLCDPAWRLAVMD